VGAGIRHPAPAVSPQSTIDVKSANVSARSELAVTSRRHPKAEAIDPARIRARCARIARSIEADMADELTLLRAARELKAAHARLRLAVLALARRGGWTAIAARADFALAEMEQDLRRALVDYLSMPRERLRDSLRSAMQSALEALDALDS